MDPLTYTNICIQLALNALKTPSNTLIVEFINTSLCKIEEERNNVIDKKLEAMKADYTMLYNNLSTHIIQLEADNKQLKERLVKLESR
jgi:hypothetical protein